MLRIRIQGSSGSGFGIRIQGLKKWSKMFNNHKIILLFNHFFNILSYNWLLLMRKYYNYEVFLIFFQIVSRNSLDPDSRSSGSGSGLRFLARSGSGFNWIRIQNTGIQVCKLAYLRILNCIIGRFRFFSHYTVLSILSFNLEVALANT